AAAQRTIQRLKAWPSRIRPNSSSESEGSRPVARCAEETMGPSSPCWGERCAVRFAARGWAFRDVAKAYHPPLSLHGRYASPIICQQIVDDLSDDCISQGAAARCAGTVGAA